MTITEEYDQYDDFDPILYLTTFYETIGPEAYNLLHFLHKVFKKQSDNCSVLEFGGGPTLVGMISAARIASEIHFAEYVPNNRNLVSAWLSGDDVPFNWQPYFENVLEMEGNIMPTEPEILTRMDLLRRKVNKVIVGDIYQSPPVDTGMQYDVIVSNYCLDSITDDYSEWLAFLTNLSLLLRRGGTISLATLKEVDHCEYQGVRYPNVYLNEDLLSDGLVSCGFIADSIHIETAPADNHEDRNYAGVLFATAIKQ